MALYQANCACSLSGESKWYASIITLQFGNSGQCEYHFEMTIWASGSILLMEGNVIKTTRVWSSNANYVCPNYKGSNVRLTGTCNDDFIYMYDGSSNTYIGGKVGDRIQFAGKYGTVVFWKG